MTARHPPLPITASDLKPEDIQHWIEHGYVKGPAGFCLNANYLTGDNLRRAIGELALRGLKPHVRLKPEP